MNNLKHMIIGAVMWHLALCCYQFAVDFQDYKNKNQQKIIEVYYAGPV